jgi:hypothetical protein
VSDSSDLTQEIREYRDAIGKRDREKVDFQEASALAMAHRMRLFRHTEVHYQLRHEDGWLLELYPGNQRICAPPRKVRAPVVDMRDRAVPWTLLDVVRAVVWPKRKPDDA